MEVCIQRDPSGLYAAADNSDSVDVPGLSFPYDPPEHTNLELNTASLSVEECLQRVIQLLRESGIL
jgi:adenylylsulfate kinase-like enzyme